MKKILFLILCLSLNFGYAQKIHQRLKGRNFEKKSVLIRSDNYNTKQDTILKRHLRHYTKFHQDTKKIKRDKPKNIEFAFRKGTKNYNLKLSKVENTTNIITSNGNTYKSTDVSYQGYVDGDTASLAALTFSDKIEGFVSTQNEQLTIEGDSTVIYDKADVYGQTPFTCGTDFVPPTSNLPTSGLVATKCVNLYWETDYDIFVQKGSVQAVTTYIQGIFNQAQTFYANDGITIKLKTLFINTTQDLYTGATANDFLDQFGVVRTSYDGDFAMLLGYKGSGGVSYVATICSFTTRFRMAYCGIGTSYNNYPTYNWTIDVICHELGHGLGSQHSFDCIWGTYNNTALDNSNVCWGITHSCPDGAIPTNGYSIMSYGHGCPQGINLAVGFLPQPRDRIISLINSCDKLQSCTPPPTDTCKTRYTPTIQIKASADSVVSGGSVTITGIVTHGGTAPQYWVKNNGSTFSTVLPATINLTSNATFMTVLLSNDSCLTQPSVMSNVVNVFVKPVTPPPCPNPFDQKATITATKKPTYWLLKAEGAFINDRKYRWSTGASTQIINVQSGTYSVTMTGISKPCIKKNVATKVVP